jgi:hypothetical protein
VTSAQHLQLVLHFYITYIYIHVFVKLSISPASLTEQIAISGSEQRTTCQ